MDTADSIRILLVDDARDFAGQTASYLEHEDEQLTVERAASAEEGLDQLDEEPPDCIVAEYELPDMDGLELLRAVRARRDREPPFILFTEHGSEEVASEAFSAGVSEYVPKTEKTDQFSVLADRIRSTVSGRRGQRRSERRRHQLEQVLTTMPSCVVQINYEGHFVYANRRAEEVLGLDPDKVSERTYNDPAWEITDLDGNPIPDEQLPFRRVRDSGTPIQDYRHTIEWPDGTRKVLSVNGAPLFDADGNVEATVFALSDITDQLERERERRKTLRRLRAVVEASPAAIMAIDLESTVELWNPAAERIFGWEADEIVGEQLPVVPEDRSDQHAHFVDHLRAGETLRGVEIKRQRKDGSLVDVSLSAAPIRDNQGKIVGIMGVLVDITERKRRERDLKRQNERLDEFAS
ncbi:MAG: PAS domain S-box protein, partial [Bradymonadaceae bacterium]